MRLRSGSLVRVLRTVIDQPASLSAIVRWPVFSPASFRMVSRLKSMGLKPRTILDVGSNIGQFAVAAKETFPAATIHAFEPHPGAFRTLQRNLRRYPDVFSHQVGIGANNGSADLHVNALDVSSSFLRLGEAHRSAFPEAIEITKVNVPVTRLDSVMSRDSLQEPVLLKIDVQGMEKEVLEGATAILPQVDHVIAELSFMPLYEGESTFRDLLGQLEQLGFKMVGAVDFLEADAGASIIQMDGLFERIRP